MFRKMMCLPLALLMSNACAMEQKTVEVVIGETQYFLLKGSKVMGADIPTYKAVTCDTATVYDLKYDLVQHGHLISLALPLYRGCEDTDGAMVVSALNDNELVVDVKKGKAVLSIYPDIYKRN